MVTLDTMAELVALEADVAGAASAPENAAGASQLGDGANIGSAGQNRRLRTGLVAFGIALTVAVVTMKLGVRPAVRGVLFVPFLAAANLIYQALFRT